MVRVRVAERVSVAVARSRGDAVALQIAGSILKKKRKGSEDL
jgi:hypothetical protein